jgi:pyridoxamine 5'-phosphate oxidase
MTVPERNEYTRGRLEASDLDRDPIRQFRAWFDEVLDADVPEPHAVSLATATADGRPSARIVLLRGYDDRGFTFFTNYESRKGRELESNPFAALLFFWAELERQVRVEGRVERVSADESDAYHRGRPLGSQLGAWASAQSEVVEREDLESRLEAFRTRYADGDVPRPPGWGGYRLVPEVFEFWQGRPSRLHDRFRYRRAAADEWIIERLAP